jgi:4'-phosphopantetheinyl transferase
MSSDLSLHLKEKISAAGRAAVIFALTDLIAGDLALSRIPLTVDERMRAESFKFQCHRDDFVASHRLLRLLAGTMSGVDPQLLTIVQHCEYCDGAHGKPVIPGLEGSGFSISHTSGFVAVACSKAGPIGVDIESFKSSNSLSVAPRCLAPLEMACFTNMYGGIEKMEATQKVNAIEALMRQWVRKEALIKIGELDIDSMRKIELGDIGTSQESLCYHDLKEHHFLEWRDGQRMIVGSAVVKDKACDPVFIPIV